VRVPLRAGAVRVCPVRLLVVVVIFCYGALVVRVPLRAGAVRACLMCLYGRAYAGGARHLYPFSLLFFALVGLAENILYFELFLVAVFLTNYLVGRNRPLFLFCMISREIRHLVYVFVNNQAGLCMFSREIVQAVPVFSRKQAKGGRPLGRYLLCLVVPLVITHTSCIPVP
jgi:hypothetical protein